LNFSLCGATGKRATAHSTERGSGMSTEAQKNIEIYGLHGCSTESPRGWKIWGEGQEPQVSPTSSSVE
jgi:hypothetical protein